MIFRNRQEKQRYNNALALGDRYLHEEEIVAGHQKFIVWEISAGGSGSTSCIFWVRDSKPYEPEISGQYMEFVFDPESGEFVKK